MALATAAGLSAQASDVAERASASSRSAAGGAARTLSPVQFNSFGWPVGGRAPAGERSRRAPATQRRRAVAAPAPAAEPKLLAEGTRARPLPSGMRSGALTEVFRATGTPGQLAHLGGVVATWKLTVHGATGEVLGERTYVHVADSAAADRDRITYGDRVFVRDGARVLAGRGGIRWESLDPMARRELELFGLHLRLPWCYGAGDRFVVLRQEAASRRGEELRGLLIERRVAADTEVFGPQRAARRCDEFRLFYDPQTGVPRELEHRFTEHRTRRRVLLDDWREFEGVRFPARRVYVDGQLQPTTTLELMDLRRRRVDDRDFRLL